METTDEKLQKLFEEKKRLLRQKGNLTHRQLEDAFHQRTTGTYLKDFIFGANDGIVTTFAVVAGATGANLGSFVVVILGFANLLADGLSMGLGNYLGERSDDLYNRGQRRKEYWEVEHFPKIEEAEVREIFVKWGFHGPELESAVTTLMKNEHAWVDFMMREELGIVESDGQSSAIKHGLAIITAFVAAGLIPLLPYVAPALHARAFTLSVVMSGLTFFVIGSLRAKLAPIRWWVSGLEVLLIGSVASGVAYVIGKVLEGIVR